MGTIVPTGENLVFGPLVKLGNPLPRFDRLPCLLLEGSLNWETWLLPAISSLSPKAWASPLTRFFHDDPCTQRCHSRFDRERRA
jgi:hypothetical protein